MDASSQLVRHFADCLGAGGQETQRAALALGLLLERESIERDDDSLGRMFGAWVASHRLTPGSMYEAETALIELLRVTAIPMPIVVWAASRSFNARVVPHLVAVLERVLGMPDVSVARQTVDCLTLFGNEPRAIAALRMAAERGRDHARESAAHWLSQQAQVAVPPRPVRSHEPVRTLELDGEVQRLQRRPHHRQVIVNDGRRGIRVLDPFAGVDVLRAEFSPRYGDNGAIRAWCLRGDGALLASLPPSGEGCLVPLSGDPVVDLDAPGGLFLDDPPYCWEPEGPLILRANMAMFWRLRWTRGVPSLELAPTPEIRRDARGWVTVLDALAARRGTILGIDPEAARVLARDGTDAADSVVSLPWRNDAELIRVNAPSYARRIAFQGDHVFLLQDHEVQAVNAAGQITDVFPAPDRMYLRALDTVPAGSLTMVEPAALVVAAAPAWGVGPSRLLTFSLDGL